eukprot:scaffold293572_cov30-Tisochrysis_lutea.AAC.1
MPTRLGLDAIRTGVLGLDELNGGLFACLQGGCQAIEDAYELTRALREVTSVEGYAPMDKDAVRNALQVKPMTKTPARPTR